MKYNLWTLKDFRFKLANNPDFVGQIKTKQLKEISNHLKINYSDIKENKLRKFLIEKILEENYLI